MGVLATGTTMGNLKGKTHTRRFWTEVYLKADDKRRDRGAGEHPPPLRSFSEDGCVLEGDRHNESQHDTERGPHLPHHR